MKKLTRRDMERSFSDNGLIPEITVYDVTDSTNVRALEYARDNKPERPIIFIANEQTAGRGRLGRSFSSPFGGIYMTILTRTPDRADTTALTSYAAVSVCRALGELTDLSPKVKWVNDVYIGSLKLSGILAQGFVDPDTNRLTHIALGIGLNVSGKELPEEIRGIATSLEAEGVIIDRAALASRIAEIYLSDLHKAGTAEIINEYRSLSMLTGADVNVIHPDRTYPARVVGIGDECELIVKTEDGETVLLRTGEVSVRPVKRY